MITAPEWPGHGLRFKEEVLKFKIWREDDPVLGENVPLVKRWTRG